MKILQQLFSGRLSRPAEVKTAPPEPTRPSAAAKIAASTTDTFERVATPSTTIRPKEDKPRTVASLGSLLLPLILIGSESKKAPEKKLKETLLP